MKKIFNSVSSLIAFLKTSLMNTSYSVNNNAFSLAFGVYVAFCPFVGFHTLMMIIAAWMFSLNGPLMITVSYLINNPWTMVPVYFFGYLVGLYMVSFLGLEHWPEPQMMNFLNDTLQHYFKLSDIRLWPFLIGGNAVGLVAGVVMYPCARYFLGKKRGGVAS